MMELQRYWALLAEQNWAAVYALLDEMRANAATPDEMASEVAFRVSTLEKQGRNHDALDLLRDRGHLFLSQSHATQTTARVLMKLGRERDALQVMSGSPYEAEMSSCPMRAMDAKFFHAVLLAKLGDPSAKQCLEGIPDDYIQVTVDGDDLITKSDVVALIDKHL